MCLAYSQAWWCECRGLGLHECMITTTALLKKRTPVATCEALVNSMPKRVKAVLENNGDN